VSTTSLNPLRYCCLTIKSRSPLAPLKKGGTRFRSKSPDNQGDLGGSRLSIKTRSIRGFRRLLTPMGSWSVPTGIEIKHLSHDRYLNLLRCPLLTRIENRCCTITGNFWLSINISTNRSHKLSQRILTTDKCC